MDTIFNDEAYRKILRRVDAIQPDSPRQWGKMTVTQMMEHLARVIEVPTGKRPSKHVLLGKLIGWIFFKEFTGPKPFRKDAPTGPDFIIKDDLDFDRTKARLRALVDELHAVGEQGCDGIVHGFFGPLTGAQWGVTQYKHLDHHFRQFGV